MSFTFDDKECRMCGKKTIIRINMNLKQVAICQNCCDTITLQNVRWLMDKSKGRQQYSSEEIE